MPDFYKLVSCWKWQKHSEVTEMIFFVAELKLLYSIVIFNFMKWLWVWIVDFDSENDRNIKQEKSDIEWTWVCWLGSSQWSNLLCSPSYAGSKGSATCKFSCTLLKKIDLKLMMNQIMIVKMLYAFYFMSNILISSF